MRGDHSVRLFVCRLKIRERRRRRREKSKYQVTNNMLKVLLRNDTRGTNKVLFLEKNSLILGCIRGFREPERGDLIERRGWGKMRRIRQLTFSQQINEAFFILSLGLIWCQIPYEDCNIGTVNFIFCLQIKSGIFFLTNGFLFQSRGYEDEEEGRQSMDHDLTRRRMRSRSDGDRERRDERLIKT